MVSTTISILQAIPWALYVESGLNINFILTCTCCQTTEADVCVCSLMPVLQEAGPFFPSCGKWKYLGWLCQHYIRLLIGSFLANHSLALVLKPHISSLGTYKAWGIFKRQILGPEPGSLVPLMHLPKAWGHQPCDKLAAVRELFAFLELNFAWCRGVSGPELSCHPWVQKNSQTLIFPPASCILPQSLWLLRNGVMQAVGSASWGQPLAGTWRQGEKDKKPLKPLLSREDEVSVDYKPECPIKDSRGCCLCIQQHHSKPVKGQNGHEENKAPHFSPAITAEGCETFTFFHHFPQKVAILPIK